MFRIFVALFVFFASTAFAQTASQPLPALTLAECLALPCNISEQWVDGPAEMLAQQYTQATEQRNRCSSVLRKEAMKTDVAVKKIACIKARQRSLACAVSQIPEDQVPLFTKMGIFPSLVTVRLLIDFSTTSKAPLCQYVSEIRKHYTVLLQTQFGDCFNGNSLSCSSLCEQFSQDIPRILPNEWGLSRKEVSAFEWPPSGFQKESLEREIRGGPWLMCSNTGFAYGF